MSPLAIPRSFPSQADLAAIVTGPNVRFTVLTSRLIRLEYNRAGTFEDRASQAFWYREQPVSSFKVTQTPAAIEIVTDHLHLRYQPTDEGFTPATLSVKLLESDVTWHFGDRDRQNLRGTARTLDGADGPIPLEPGLMSRSGWAVVDDSKSLVFNGDGWLAPRPPAEDGDYRDLYFFGHGHDYVGCLQDFTRVSGRVPMVPRFALGNWWSRYWAYHQEELIDLMEEFRAKFMPLSVCIIDMDWHLTETCNASSGWTGYTWNPDLWPNPRSFISWAQGMGMRIALNLHPAEGVWPHEAQYEAMARWMGQDPAKQDPVPFDPADPHFVEGYFEILHHPMEGEGVDFWWLDWQQGARLTQSGSPLAKVLDPLWWLNHLHFYDLGRDGTKRPFIFSRWGGLGSHRYPIGFSGDSHVTWATLAFQPYFTATAANVAFGWWSHDIGGHFEGVENPELYARWVQLGVFSPILRLHCSNNPFQDRRPWAHGDDVFRVARAALQRRHTLIPYLYSMAWRLTQESIPLVTPLYYSHAEEEAYRCPHQFMFGSELLVAPFVSPRHAETNLSRQTVWLPEGDWFDFTTGEHFAGGRAVTVYGKLDDIPVFARAGGIVPLGPRVPWSAVANPKELTVYVFPGADGEFTLYEDDGESTAYLDGDYALTRLSQQWEGSRLTFRIAKVEGNAAHVPAGRTYRLVCRSVRNPDAVRVALNGAEQGAEWGYDEPTESLWLTALPVGPADDLEVTIEVGDGSLLSKRDRRLETCRAMLRSFRLESVAKLALDQALPGAVQDPDELDQLACELDCVTEAQWLALRNVVGRHLTRCRGPAGT
jgi:alpha-glucosidase (family GH31 glycosyl hydrolase)